MKNMRFKVNRFLQLAYFAAFFLFLSGCSIIQKYQRPDDLDYDKALKWSEELDSTSIAKISFKDFFTDSLLVKQIEVALGNNLDIKQAYARINIAKAYFNQSKNAFFPTLSAGPAVSYQSNSQNTQIGGLFGKRQHIVQYDLSMDVSWEADIWGKLSSAKRAAFADMMQSEMAAQTVKSRLIAEIASSYFRLVALDKQQDILDTTIANRQKNIETSTLLKNGGILTEVAVQQSTAQYYNAKGLLINNKLAIQQLENYICLLQGTTYHAIQREKFDETHQDVTLAHGVPSDLLANRPDVVSAEYALRSSFEMLNVARAQMYPTLRLDASTGLQSIDISNLFSVPSLFGSVIGNLTQPILNRGVLKTMKKVRELEKDQAYLNYKNTLLQASSEVTDALNSIEAQTQLINIKSNEYQSYAKAISYSKELVTYGMANYLEVLRATDNALIAQLDYTNAYFGKWNGIVQLYLALGGGWH